MKLPTLSAAVLVASSFVASGAMAGLNLNGIDPSRPAANNYGIVEISVVGSSSMDNAFLRMIESMCTPNTLSVYSDRCSVAPGGFSDCYNFGSNNFSAPRLPSFNYAAYFCEMTPSTVASLSGPTNVLVRKRSVVGSGPGIQLVADATPTQQMLLNAQKCKVTSVPDFYLCMGNPDLREHSSGTEGVVVDAGLSDVEPGLFYGSNIAHGGAAISSALLARLGYEYLEPINALIFGVPVTNALYAALQRAQGLNPDLDGDGIFEGESETATEQEIQDNMPSLTREQVAALFKGSIVSWANVFSNGVALTSVGGGIPAPADSRVTICRRVNGSGTQTQFNALFLNTPCSDLAGDPASDNTPCSTTTGGRGTLPFCATSSHYRDLTGITAGQTIIHENSGSTHLDICLDELNSGNRWALGIQSLEKKSPNYSFIKIDGVAPTLENVAKGKYWNWSTTFMYWRKQSVNGVAAPTGNKLAILQQLRRNFFNPRFLQLYNNADNAAFYSYWGYPSGYHGFGASGYLAVNGAPRPFRTYEPVMQYKRSTTCSTPVARAQIDL
jgi:ABC-type phosphate transport system substrate-binding protein